MQIVDRALHVDMDMDCGTALPLLTTAGWIHGRHYCGTVDQFRLVTHFRIALSGLISFLQPNSRPPAP